MRYGSYYSQVHSEVIKVVQKGTSIVMEMVKSKAQEIIDYTVFRDRDIPLGEIEIPEYKRRMPNKSAFPYCKVSNKHLGQTIVLSYRDGRYYVIDGVKTIVSFKNRMSGDTLINCFVARNNSIADEIQLLEALHCRR